MEKETDGHTVHKKPLTLTTLRMTNMEEEMDWHKARMGSLILLHRRIKQTSPQWTVHAVNELFCCSPGIMGGPMNISCCPSRGMTGGIMYAEDVCRYAYTKTPELTSRTKTSKWYQPAATRCRSIPTSWVRLVTFAAKTLGVALQLCVFLCVLSAIHVFLMAVLKEHLIVLSLLRTRKTSPPR